MRAQTTEAQERLQPTGLGWIQDGPLEEEVLREGAGSPLYTKEYGLTGSSSQPGQVGGMSPLVEQTSQAQGDGVA